MIQAGNEEGLQYFFDTYGNNISNGNGLYNTGAKYAGTAVGSAFYTGGSLLGDASRALPYIGPAIDVYAMIKNDESNASQKFVMHLAGNAVGTVVGTAVATYSAASVAATIGGVLGTAIPIPIVGTVIGVAVGTTVGFAINILVDFTIDSLSK
ncbi:hypothetical protein EID31_12175 [Enterococcus faecalis]|nr:hypothetical protein [Enterococcus faecalis]